MGVSYKTPALLWLVCSAFIANAQNGNTFAYTGDDALRLQANVHYAHFGGFSNSVLIEEQRVIYPFLPALFYEMNYLVLRDRKHVNVGLGVSPEVFLTVLFMARAFGTVDVLLFNEASNKPGNGIGLRAGLGYSVLGSTFDLTESTPVFRAGLTISNIRITYAHALGDNILIDHHLGVGIKFDW
jgi:hypothetical protein